MSARRFYVLLRGLPPDGLFWQLCRKTPHEVNSRAEIERITAMARR